MFIKRLGEEMCLLVDTTGDITKEKIERLIST